MDECPLQLDAQLGILKIGAHAHGRTRLGRSRVPPGMPVILHSYLTPGSGVNETAGGRYELIDEGAAPAAVAAGQYPLSAATLNAAPRMISRSVTIRAARALRRTRNTSGSATRARIPTIVMTIRISTRVNP